jgi:hypothetical protein
VKSAGCAICHTRCFVTPLDRSMAIARELKPGSRCIQVPAGQDLIHLRARCLPQKIDQKVSWRLSQERRTLTQG